LAGLVTVPFALVVPMALLTHPALLPPAVALSVMMVVALWRGRRRVPDLLRTLRSWLASDETVLGDGLGMVPGMRGQGALRLSSLAYLVPLNLVVAPAFFFADAGVVLGLMVIVRALGTVGLWIGSALRQAPPGEEPRAPRGSLRDAVSGAALVRISSVLPALIVGLVGATAAAELTDLRLAVEQATANQLPVDGRSNLNGGAASLTYTPGPGLHELVTDEQPLSGPYDGAGWELDHGSPRGI
jgi:hypothetical protein